MPDTSLPESLHHDAGDWQAECWVCWDDTLMLVDFVFLGVRVKADDLPADMIDAIKARVEEYAR